jgi:hypothetical protein
LIPYNLAKQFLPEQGNACLFNLSSHWWV